jgi:hypothetical protein
MKTKLKIKKKVLISDLSLISRGLPTSPATLSTPVSIYGEVSDHMFRVSN